MSIHRRPARALALAALVALAVAPARADVIVNVNASHYGYVESPTIPNIGTRVTPISEAPGGEFKDLILTAGIYKITNAAGQLRAKYDGFRFNQETTGENWTWNFLLTNADDGNKAILFGGADTGLFATQAGAAAKAAAYVGYFALAVNTTLNFMISDNSVGDNTGGVSLRITRIGDLDTPGEPAAPITAPEPAAFLMMALGAILPVAAIARRRKPTAA
ncbi:PEP-CTERM sorting domain-containing protein [Paludisphaera sp.]|uniref:PEP-CTERM sorting domain-containing protein n=1 Tax=Paludisphaera sp. TaxID=2017432 RepID=UPI00301D57E1